MSFVDRVRECAAHRARIAKALVARERARLRTLEPPPLGERNPVEIVAWHKRWRRALIDMWRHAFAVEELRRQAREARRRNGRGA